MKLVVGLTAICLILGVPGAGAQEPPQAGELIEETGELEVPAEDAASEGTVSTPLIPESRTEFRIPMPEDQGGGQVIGEADAMVRRGDNTISLVGNVKVGYQNLTIQADRADVDLATRIVKATGNVILDEGPNRYGATVLTYNLDDKTGTMEQATANLQPDIYFRGDLVEKVGDASYVVTNGMFSACEGDVPVWSFRTGKAKVTLEGYARASNVTMRAKKLPVFYAPYLLFPVKSKRTSGFLLPNFSSSERHGTNVGVAYYQTLGPSYDVTLFADFYSEDFFGYATEFRYHPSQRTRGELRARFVDHDVVGADGVTTETEHRITFKHETRDLPGGLRAFVDIVDFSDFEFFRDFDRDLPRISRRSWQSRAYLTGAWGPQSMNLRFDQRETLNTDKSNTIQRQLPEFEYRLRQVQVGETPFYFQMQGAAHVISVERGFDDPDTPTRKTDYARAHILPTLTLPLDTVPWLQINLKANARTTWYQKSKVLAPAVDEELPEGSPEVGTIEGESLTRFVPGVGAEIVGPSFSKIFNSSLGSFEKFKHVIEPRFEYAFTDEFEDEDRVPSFDELDRVDDQHRATARLVNRLIAKPKAPEEWVRGIIEGEGDFADEAAVEAEGGLSDELPAIAVGFGQDAEDEITPPELIRGAPPKYPEAAKEAKIEGSMILRVVVTEAGRVTDVEVLEGLDPALDLAAVTAVSKWAFNPATNPEGLPVSVPYLLKLDLSPGLEQQQRKKRAVGTREIMTFELAQSYSLDDRTLQSLTIPGLEEGEPSERITDTTGPILLRYRFNPSRVTSLRADASYNTLANEFSNYTISGELGFDEFKRNFIGISWNRRFFLADDPLNDRMAGDASSDQLGLRAGMTLWNGRIEMRGSVNLNLEPGDVEGPGGDGTTITLEAPKLQRQSFRITYNGNCAGLRLEFRESRRVRTLSGLLQEVKNQQYRVVVSLKHIGSFLDFGFGDRRNNDTRAYRF